MRQQTRLLRALALTDQLIRVTDQMDEKAAHRLAVRLKSKLQPRTGIRDILAKIPAETLTSMADTLKVSRQTIYNWRDGNGRPTRENAAKLAKLTGVSADVIRAR